MPDKLNTMILETFHVIQPNGRKRIKVKIKCTKCGKPTETHKDNYNKSKNKKTWICRKCQCLENVVKGQGKKLSRKYPQLQGENSPNWSGGRRIGKDGYVMIYVSEASKVRGIKGSGWKSYRKEHTVLMERSIGKKLKKGQLVHHIDGNRQNNDLVNLVLLNNHFQHKVSHNSLQEIGYQLVKTGLVTFDRNTNTYIVANDKLRELLGQLEQPISSQAEKSEGSETRGEINSSTSAGQSEKIDDIVRTTQGCVELKDKEPLG